MNVADPVVSVVLCTFNRSRLVENALDSLMRQVVDTPPYEIVVVDNNSSDATREVVERFAASGIVRYRFEPTQGLSTARNHGIRAARADILAFVDDDVRVSRTWVRSIAETFARHEEADMIGGKVEPEWDAPPPSWLSQAGYAPLAVVDYGDEPFRITSARPVCLIGANVAVRRRAFERVGGFSTEVQRLRDGIGSTEDHEFQARLMGAGGCAFYEPRMVVRAAIPAERLSKRYHRAWHQGHGRFYALMHDASFERSSRGTVMGVPAHVYRSVLHEGAAWIASVLSRRTSAAFAHELRLRFLMAFARQRILQRS